MTSILQLAPAHWFMFCLWHRVLVNVLVRILCSSCFHLLNIVIKGMHHCTHLTSPLCSFSHKVSWHEQKAEKFFATVWLTEALIQWSIEYSFPSEASSASYYCPHSPCLLVFWVPTTILLLNSAHSILDFAPTNSHKTLLETNSKGFSTSLLQESQSPGLSFSLQITRIMI
jgi:hypothetical protein